MLLTGQVLAQDVHLGLKAGVNAYNLLSYDRNSGNKIGNTDYKPGFHVGGLAHIHLSRQWAIQPELVYSGQGGRQNINGVDTKWNLDYVNVPVLVQYMFDNGFRLQAGPQLGFLASAKQVRESNITNVRSSYNGLETALTAGVSYVSYSGLGVDARWVFGLNNIAANSGNTLTRNNGAQLGIFYLLNYHP